MPTAGNLNCCGINCIGNFPFDASDAYTAEEIAKIPSEVKKLEGTYAPVKLIALRSNQSQAAVQVRAMGYVEIGTYPSTHRDGTMVTLFMKGLTLVPQGPVKKVAKKPIRRKTR